MNIAFNLALAACICLGTGLGHYLDDIPDHSAEWAASQSLIDAQKEAQNQSRRQADAQAMCQSDFGINVEAAWVSDSEVICQPKRGKSRIITAQSAIK